MYAWDARQDLDLSGLESRVFDGFVNMLIMVTQMHEFICIAFFLISTCLRNILIILGANCNWYRFSVFMNFISTILILAVVGFCWSSLRGKEEVKFLLSSHPVPRDNWLTTTPNPGNNWQNWCHYHQLCCREQQSIPFTVANRDGEGMATNRRYRVSSWIHGYFNHVTTPAMTPKTLTMSISYHSLRVVLSVVVKVRLLI